MKTGMYQYFLNGQPTGITENFQIESLPDDMQKTSAIREATTFKTRISLEAVHDKLNFKSFEIQMTNAEAETIRAVYEFADQKVFVARQINGENSFDEEITLPENCIIFPLMRVFQGAVISKVAESNQAVPVLIPAIENPADTTNLLRPTFDLRRAEQIGEESITFYQPHSVTINTRIYSYTGKHYDEKSRFWIDENGLLVSYIFHQAEDKIWEMILS